jgi:pyruvate dehydrogenase E1 component alpha subunit
MSSSKTKGKPALLEEYGATSGKMLQILDYEGGLILPKRMPDLSPDDIVAAYKRMLYARTADQMAVSYQRQGRMYTYPPNFGQEAIGVAVGTVMRESDWLVPAYRELGAWLAKGASMKDIFLYFGGHEDGSILADAPNMLPSAVPIASQLPHAAGIGYALKYQGKNDVVFTFVGDGGTSQGDFHEALNFAGVWKAPVVFVIQNNQYAISHPRSQQTAAKSLAVKAEGYGIPGIQVDGNDYLAMVAAVQAAADYARSGQGPVLIEGVTYRRGAHTTSDDPGRYRTEEEEQKWAERDPLKRLKGYLIAKKLWDESGEEPLISQYKKEIDQQFTEMENQPYELKDIFIHHYAEMPDDLQQQLVAYEKFLNWKESQQ